LPVAVAVAWVAVVLVVTGQALGLLVVALAPNLHLPWRFLQTTRLQSARVAMVNQVDQKLRLEVGANLGVVREIILYLAQSLQRAVAVVVLMATKAQV
jgi:hypothetical protein